MSKTLIAKLSKMSQFDPVTKTILWQDDTPSRWKNIYSQLVPGFKVIFSGVNDNFFFGDVARINANLSVLCNNVIEVSLKNDNFLRLNEAYPEIISQMKAHFPPFIHINEINHTLLLEDISEKRFINFYILRSQLEYEANKSQFVANDRIFILKNRKIESVLIYNGTDLVAATSEINSKLKVKGMSLDEMLKINESRIHKTAKKTTRSNNVERLKNIIHSIENEGIFKFSSFFTYHDTMFNNIVYNSVKKQTLRTIILKAEQNVFKISMSPKDIDDDSYERFVESGYVIVHKDTKAMVGSNQSQGQIFENEIKIGDYFYLSRGNSYFELVGKITGAPEPCDDEEWGDEDWLQRSFVVEQIATAESKYDTTQKWWTPNFNSTCIPIPQKELELSNNLIFRPFYNIEFSLENKKDLKTDSMKLNQILYGPPGTGKTYNSINRAIEIINPAFNLSQDRTIVKAEFDRLEKNGQILFTTFHQSMSYEDFIEGIKPETIDKRVMYDIQNGIFKILANRALFSFYNSTNTTTLREFESFDQIYDAYLENLGSRLANKTDRLLLPLRSKNYFVEVLSIDDTSIETKGASAANKAFVEKEKLRLLYNKFKSVEDIKNVSEDIRAVGRGLGWSSNYYGIFKDFKEYENNTLKEDKKAIPETVKTLSDEQIEAYLTSLPNKYNVSFESNPENFVLIIDEINRGNISQIFGELITLIEDDKRAGKPEALAITLPYSKEKLSVPPNLYIVGTMNTADRSVEALDTALRRRFSFEEMPPKPELLSPQRKLWDMWWNYPDLEPEKEPFKSEEEALLKLLGIDAGDNVLNPIWKKMEEDGVKLEKQISYLNGLEVKGIDLSELLKIMNIRIEKLLDKDHLIGHSFFMSVNSLSELQTAFYDKIIPLLQEYFFGDFGKIGLVLGKGFVNVKTKDENEDVFAEFDHDSKSDFNQREVFEIIDYRTENLNYELNKVKMNFEEAIHLLLKKKSA